MLFLVILTQLGLLASAFPHPGPYSGYKLIDTQIIDERCLDILTPLEVEWDFWEKPRLGKTSRIFVSPQEFREVKGYLESKHIGYQVAVEDVQESLEASEQSEQIPQQYGQSISFTKFNTLSEIHTYLDDLAVRFPRLVSVESIGKSLEGRDLKLIKISSGGSTNKPAIFLDAGIHSVEWISPPVALYVIQQLVENYSINRDLVDHADWYIIPILNPDGYEHTHTSNRLWRKTRSYNGNILCLGVDPNRNFDYHWGGVGASTSHCSQTFRGPKAFSEPETLALANYILSSSANFQLYLTLHSYGQLILYPWGYTKNPPEDAVDLDALGKAAAAALEKVRGTKYTVGGSAAELYDTSGTSQDWAKGQAGIKYSYTVELPAGGLIGFNPPASAIIPVVEETFEAIKVFGGFIGGILKLQHSPE